MTEAEDYNYPARLFNKAWGEMLKRDPPPDSIKSIIAEIGREEDEPLKFDGCEFANIRQFNIAWKNEVEKPL